MKNCVPFEVQYTSSTLTPAPLQVFTSKTPQPLAQPFYADLCTTDISIRARLPLQLYGLSMLVCTQGAAFEMDWWQFWAVSVNTTILHAFLSAPACIACTDMVHSKELERDITTTAMAKAILRLKSLAFIPS